MSEITIMRPVKVEAKFLKVEAEVRYWEDGTINGQPDNDDAPTMPCRRKDCWAPVIELDTGKIEGWPGGTTAEVHYKVCDAGVYTLLDAGRETIISIDGYVPSIMSPGGNGYGDYIVMTIGPDGVIADWRADLAEFVAAAKEAPHDR